MKCKRWVRGRNPLDTLQRTMEALGLDAEAVAVRGLMPLSQVRQIVEGVLPITADVTFGLERAIGERWAFNWEPELDHSRCS